jgi:hypothetical protein
MQQRGNIAEVKPAKEYYHCYGMFARQPCNVATDSQPVVRPPTPQHNNTGPAAMSVGLS